jgi:uncharacterized protein YutE (UPF0331/DUF86 family)
MICVPHDSKVLYFIILAIMLIFLITSTCTFLLGVSPQAGSIINPLLWAVIVYSGFLYFVTHPDFFSHIAFGPAGFQADLRTAKEAAVAIKAEETVAIKAEETVAIKAEETVAIKAEETVAIKAEEAASEAKEELREIQESDTSTLGVFLQLANEIETKLRIIGELKGPSGYKYTSMARYARDLAKANIISSRLADLIARFRNVRNEIVHYTRNISRSQLEDAIYIGEVILTELNKIYDSL